MTTRNSITTAVEQSIVFVGAPKFEANSPVLQNIVHRWPHADYGTASQPVMTLGSLLAIIVDPREPLDERVATFAKGINQLAGNLAVTTVAFVDQSEGNKAEWTAHKQVIDDFCVKRPDVAVRVYSPPVVLVAGDPYFRKVSTVRTALAELPQGSTLLYASGLQVGHLVYNIEHQGQQYILRPVTVDYAGYGQTAVARCYSDMFRDFRIDQVLLFHSGAERPAEVDATPIVRTLGAGLLVKNIC